MPKVVAIQLFLYMPWNLLCFDLSYFGLLLFLRTLFWGIFWHLGWSWIPPERNSARCLGALPSSRPPTSPLEVSWGSHEKHELDCRSLWESSWCYEISPHSTEMEMDKFSYCFLLKSRLPFRRALMPLGSQVSSGSPIPFFTWDVPETSSLHLCTPWRHQSHRSGSSRSPGFCRHPRAPFGFVVFWYQRSSLSLQFGRPRSHSFFSLRQLGDILKTLLVSVFYPTLSQSGYTVCHPAGCKASGLVIPRYFCTGKGDRTWLVMQTDLDLRPASTVNVYN